MKKKYSIGLFLLRVVVGVTFFLNGLDKFQAGIGGTAEFFSSLGLPGFTAYIVATIELVGGLLMIAGIGTKIISALFAIIMVGAIIFANFPEGFLGGFDMDLILLVVSIHLLLNGSHYLAVDSYFANNKQESVSSI